MLKKNVNKKERKKIKPLTETEYFMFLSVVFILTGMMLFVYCRLMNYNILDVPVFQNPLFHFGLGLSCLLTYITLKVFKKGLNSK